MSMSIPIAVAAISAAGSLFGQNRAAEEQKRREEALAQRQKETEDLYHTEQNQDYLDTTAARSALQRLNDFQKKAGDSIRMNSARTGGTAEAETAAETAVAGQTGQAIGQLAAIGTDFRNRSRDRYQSIKNSLDNQADAISAQKVASQGQFAGNIANAVSNLALAWAYGGGQGGGDMKATPLNTSTALPTDNANYTGIPQTQYIG